MNAPPIRQTSSLAVISLVAGLLGWTVAPFLGSLGAVICGHLARAEIRRAPDRLEGDGLAIAGLVLGWSMIIVTLMFLVALFMFFGGLATILAWLAASAPGPIST
ncbi:MAG: DUF4190 domain-containing protein [Xanthomonadaceae bacterium]|jgi:hypothetical protein|nr:DUF4190 domain-containing protein [Xanthomonadaceae bacterium]